MTQVTPQLQETLFEMGDFPPVALLDSAFKTNNINGDKFIKDMLSYLGGDKGTNTHPLFIETILAWVTDGGDFAPLVTPSDTKPESIQYFIETKQISESFLKHCIRFRVMPTTIIDWTVILNNSINPAANPNITISNYNAPTELTIEDAYYLTAISNKIVVPAYRIFIKVPNKLDEKNRLRYESIKAYDSLQKRLHEEGQQYTSKQVFTVCELYTIDDIIKLVKVDNFF